MYANSSSFRNMQILRKLLSFQTTLHICQILMRFNDIQNNAGRAHLKTLVNAMFKIFSFEYSVPYFRIRAYFKRFQIFHFAVSGSGGIPDWSNSINTSTCTISLIYPQDALCLSFYFTPCLLLVNQCFHFFVSYYLSSFMYLDPRS